jgi:hypothetical protein
MRLRAILAGGDPMAQLAVLNDESVEVFSLPTQ